MTFHAKPAKTGAKPAKVDKKQTLRSLRLSLRSLREIAEAKASLVFELSPFPP